MHYRPEAIVDYFDGILTPAQEEAMETHMGDCPICAGLARRVRETLSLWDGWSAAAMRRAPAEPAPRSLFDLESLLGRAEEALPAGEGERIWGLGPLLERAREAMRERGTTEGTAVPALVRRFTIAEDGFYLMAAGEEERPPCSTSPLWYTLLLEPPTRLAWLGGGEGPWRVCLRSTEHGNLHERVVESSRLPLDATERARLPRGEFVRWQVSRESSGPDTPPLVRGVFKILAPGAAEASALPPVAKLRQPPEEFEALFQLAARCREAQLFEDTVRLATLGLRLAPGAAQRLLCHRLVASVYRTVADVLASRFRLGDPEGLWAGEMARRSVLAAARLLGLDDTY